MTLTIKICMGSACFQRGNKKNLDLIETYLRENDFTATVELVGSRCEKHCYKGPNLIINEQIFHGINPQMLTELLQELVGRELISEEKF